MTFPKSQSQELNPSLCDFKADTPNHLEVIVSLPKE